MFKNNSLQQVQGSTTLPAQEAIIATQQIFDNLDSFTKKNNRKIKSYSRTIK